MNTTKKAREVLKLLECPYLLGLDESVIHELLLSRGEARQRLLRWLLERSHPVIQNSLVLSVLKSDIGITARLTELLSILGVCSANDYNLVKGSSSVVKQGKFWEALTDVVYFSCLIGNVDDIIFQSRLSEMRDSFCAFLESFLVEEDVSTVFNNGEITLISAEISHVANIDKHLLKMTKVQVLIPIKISISNLKKQICETNEMSIKLQLQLNGLMEQTYLSLDANAIYSCTTGIQLCLDTLLQLMDDFVRCYHDEIEPWTKKDTSMLTSLGPLCKRVNCSLLIVIELLESCLKLEAVCFQWRNKLVSKKSIPPKETFKQHIHVFKD